MTEKDLARMTVIDRCQQGTYTNQQAAQVLKLSIRQIQRLKRKADAGVHTILHAGRGREPVNKTPTLIRQKVLEIAVVPHFRRACQALMIPIHIAQSPEAKGRIKRLWNTLQDRLAKDMKRHGIDTLEAANEYVRTYMESHNRRFACEPASPDVKFMPRIPDHDLHALFGEQFSRKLDNGLTFSLKGQTYAVPDTYRNKRTPFRPKEIITISQSKKLGLRVLMGTVWIEPTSTVKPTRQRQNTRVVMNEQELSEFRSVQATKNKHKTPWSAGWISPTKYKQQQQERDSG